MSAELLTVRVVATEGPTVVVALSGEFDLAHVARVTRHLADHIAAGGRYVTVDLSALTFLDSAGVHALAMMHDELLAADGRLMLTGVGPRTAKLLSITELDTTLFHDGAGPDRRLRSVTTPR